jgi:hypothetical protein
MRFNRVFKRFILFFLFSILILLQLKSQDLVFEGKELLFKFSPRDFILQLSPNYVYREDAFPRITGSINMQYFVAGNVSINGNLSIGQDYIHFGPGLLGIPLISLGGLRTWLAADEFLLFLVIVAGSFENTAFHFPVSHNLDISPYFSLLRFQYLYEPPTSQYNDFSLSLALGSRLNIFFAEQWIIAPYFEYTRTYFSRFNGFQGGILIGYYFKSGISVETE